MRSQVSIVGAVSLALVLASGCKDDPVGKSPPPTGGESPDLAPIATLQPGLKVVADNPALLAGSTGMSFDLFSTRALLVRLETPVLPSDPLWVDFDMQTPMGTGFQTRQFPFSANQQITELPSPAGMQYTVTVSRPTPIPGGYGLDFAIPVGGTSLVRHPQPGQWRFHASVEGAAIEAEQPVELRVP
jgi:hypothetical protein